MSEIIINTGEYLNCKKRFLELFNASKKFEDNPFKENFKCFSSFDFDYIFDEHFFSLLMTFFKINKQDDLVFYTDNPDPQEYYNYFKRYNIFKFDTLDSFSQIEEVLYQGPDNETINSIGISVNDFALFSFNSNEWAILGSRDLELAIIGFSNIKLKSEFLNIFSGEYILPIEENINVLDDIINFNEKQKVIYQSIIDNFSDK